MGAGCTKSEAKAPGSPGIKAADESKVAENVEKRMSNACEEGEQAQQSAVESLVKEGEAEKEKGCESEGKPGSEKESQAERKPESEDGCEAAGKQLSEEEPATQALEPDNDNTMLSEADKQLLTAAKQHVASSSPSASSPVAYLFYASSLQGGSLIQQWVAAPMTDGQMKAKKLVLLATLIPAKHKVVQKAKLQQNGGVTVFVDEILYKWDVWGKSQRQAYYRGWTKFLKAADDMEATVKLHDFAGLARPAQVYVLHTGPTENRVLPVNFEEDLQISMFAFVSVVPSSTTYKRGAAISPKKFGDIATEAGGAYIQLSRRGGDAALDQVEMIKWLAADGLEAQKAGQGITLDAAGSYEVRSEKKGGTPAA